MDKYGYWASTHLQNNFNHILSQRDYLIWYDKKSTYYELEMNKLKCH